MLWFSNAILRIRLFVQYLNGEFIKLCKCLYNFANFCKILWRFTNLKYKWQIFRNMWITDNNISGFWLFPAFECPVLFGSPLQMGPSGAYLLLIWSYTFLSSLTVVKPCLSTDFFKIRFKSRSAFSSFKSCLSSLSCFKSWLSSLSCFKSWLSSLSCFKSWLSSSIICGLGLSHGSKIRPQEGTEE